jgi:predicted RNase H-like HicB family nuclease
MQESRRDHSIAEESRRRASSRDTGSLSFQGRAPNCADLEESRWQKEWRRAYNRAMKHLTVPIILEADSDGYFVSCPALQGCYSQGDTYEQAVENIKDAIRLHIEDRLADGEEIPEHVSVSLSTVEIAV